MEIIITIPDAKVERVQDSFKNLYGYQTTINGSPNPETLETFVNKSIAQYVLSILKNYEIEQAVSATKAATQASIDADVVISATIK